MSNGDSGQIKKAMNKAMNKKLRREANILLTVSILMCNVFVLICIDICYILYVSTMNIVHNTCAIFSNTETR